jgi:Zn-finger nucleic acid-binding protein
VTKCARCEIEMKTVTAGEIELDVCSRCKGIWFDGDELARVSELDQAELAGLGSSCGDESGDRIVFDHPPAFCPRCSASLKPQCFDREIAVVIDLCPHGHGIWLDEGELASVRSFCARQKARLAREEKLMPWRKARERELEVRRIKENLRKGERDLLIADILMGIIEAACIVFFSVAAKDPATSIGIARTWRGGWKSRALKKKQE